MASTNLERCVAGCITSTQEASVSKNQKSNNIHIIINIYHICALGHFTVEHIAHRHA